MIPSFLRFCILRSCCFARCFPAAGEVPPTAPRAAYEKRATEIHPLLLCNSPPATQVVSQSIALIWLRRRIVFCRIAARFACQRSDTGGGGGGLRGRCRGSGNRGFGGSGGVFSGQLLSRCLGGLLRGGFGCFLGSALGLPLAPRAPWRGRRPPPAAFWCGA